MWSHQPLSNSTKELFPYQHSPDTAGGNIWCAFLLHLTRVPTYSLIQPLGRWLHSSHALICKWQSFIDLSTDIIFLRKQDIFKVYETLPPTPHYEYTRTTHTHTHTITHNHTQSHTITHNHTQSHTITHNHTHTLNTHTLNTH